ncbi:MAG: hypothetical protein NE327_17845, partial [Lentisphaeraceae bacterium]|nr:hypothetical protein [Lentisphaeraceae bacterium]
MRYLAFLQVLLVFWTLTPLTGDEVQDLYRTGKYEESLKLIEAKGGRTLEKIKILKTLGRYEDALKEWMEAGIRSSDITALYEGIELFRMNGREKDAQHLISRL